MQLIAEDRRITYSVVLGIPAMLIAWAVAHDQYLVRIAPEHFTEYHEPLWNISNPPTLAAVYAFGATIGPGLIMGLLSAFFGRHGEEPKVPVRTIFLGFLIVIAVTEALGALAGFVVWKTGEPIYPQRWYPDRTLPIAITQSIQITCYATASVASAFYCIALWMLRRRCNRRNGAR